MEIKYSVSLQDILEAQNRHGGAFGRILSWFGLPLVAVGLFAAFSGRTPVASSITTASVGLILLFRTRVAAWSSFKRDFAGHPEVTASFSETGIRFASAKGVGEIFWSSFVRFEETPHLFILYPQSNAFQVIPKRVVPPETLPALQNILTSQLEQAQRTAGARKDVRLYILLAVTAVMAILLIIVIAKIH